MNKPLPIGVLIPTRNVASSLPDHLKGMAAWADLVEEIVVVDSHSTDGTVELFTKTLSHPKLRVLSHPPGLYESWNHGIKNIQSQYTYISTVGDAMSREGLQALAAAAEKFHSDVVLSQPRFIDAAGKPVTTLRWPIHEIVGELAMTEPIQLSSEQALYYAIKFGIRSILGSSASNLYRTEILQKNPFPTDFGHAGDTAWGIVNAAKARFSIVPGEFSSFVVDPKYQRDANDGFPTKIFWLSCQVMTETMSAWMKEGNPQKTQTLCAAIAEAGRYLLHEGQPFQKMNSELQRWAENTEKLLAAERKLARDNLQWAEKTEALLAQERARLADLKRHWWVRLGKNSKLINLQKLGL